jgi:hypothetical protein
VAEAEDPDADPFSAPLPEQLLAALPPLRRLVRQLVEADEEVAVNVTVLRRRIDELELELEDAQDKGERNMHTYIHAYMHNTCIHTCMHTYIHTCIHAYIHTCIHACIHTNIHSCIHTSHCLLACLR